MVNKVSVKEEFTLKIRKTPDSKRVRRKSHGKHSGLGVFEFFVLLFEANERLPRNQKLTDAEIARQVIREYPDRSIAAKLQSGELVVGKYRCYYNSGRLNNGVKPLIKSARYGETGEQVNDRTGEPMVAKEAKKAKRVAGGVGRLQRSNPAGGRPSGKR